MTTAAEVETTLQRVRGYVIDMDGVLYRGDTLLPHVAEFLAALDARGVSYVMATNNSTLTPEQYVEKLASMGIQAEASRILTSGLAARAWLDQQYPAGTRIYVIGMPPLLDVILGDGRFVPAGVDAEVVVAGADFELTYEKLRVATLAIRNGARFVATNPDRTLPTEEGLIPGAGALLAALEAATDVKPLVIGKPEPSLPLQSAAILGTAPEETAMLGDRFDTDIAAGHAAGFTTVLVLTGVTQPEDLLDAPFQPDLVVPDLAPLVAYYTSR